LTPSQRRATPIPVVAAVPSIQAGVGAVTVGAGEGRIGSIQPSERRIN